MKCSNSNWEHVTLQSNWKLRFVVLSGSFQFDSLKFRDCILRSTEKRLVCLIWPFLGGCSAHGRVVGQPTLSCFWTLQRKLLPVGFARDCTTPSHSNTGLGHCKTPQALLGAGRKETGGGCARWWFHHVLPMPKENVLNFTARFLETEWIPKLLHLWICYSFPHLSVRVVRFYVSYPASSASASGPQLQALDRSGPNWTRTATSGSECFPPDLHRKLRIKAPDQSVPRRTSTTKNLRIYTR